MDKSAYIRLLEEHDIKPTANRITVVEALDTSILPQSLAELERRIQTIDKSNIFRALTLFHERRIVHTIEGGNDGTRYELCHSHSHEQVPQLCLPQGFKMHSVNYMIKGICPHCHSES